MLRGLPLALTWAAAWTVAADVRCGLPGALRDTLVAYEQLLGDRAGDPARVVAECCRSVQEAFLGVCESLFAEPSVAAVDSGAAFHRPTWRRGIGGWVQSEIAEIRAWAARRSECVAPSLQLRISVPFLHSFGEQLALMLKQYADEAADRRGMKRAIYRFQSSWSMAVYYLTLLQAFSLSGFDSTNQIAFDLHRHRYQGSSADEAWAKVVLSLPVFLLSRGELVRHDGLASTAVLRALQARMAPGRKLRFAEVGVFRANLSAHVWRRAAWAPGGLEMHLVDHWGVALVANEGLGQPVGTGSNMGGSSNSSLFHQVVRRFARTGARCVQVPHWLPGRAPQVVMALGGDVFFHRTTSAGAARSFADGSLDAVYIDADHKWWSVVQDLAAWWPKVRPGGVILGHDFHLNALMEREGDVTGDSNDVPLAVLAFFRAPLQVELHTGFVWSVEKPLDDAGGSISLPALCAYLRERMAPHWLFEVCDD